MEKIVIPYEGSKNRRRVRVGELRILFEKLSDGKIIIRKIGSRGDIYK
ncbi:MAG TPA: hypothetical protein PKC14_02620 [Candidatus Absconditabacterales bacterium]|nr:hypothetical protein [Candidatus Absconditabacterales bacterium]